MIKAQVFALREQVSQRLRPYGQLKLGQAGLKKVFEIDIPGGNDSNFAQLSELHQRCEDGKRIKERNKSRGKSK